MNILHINTQAGGGAGIAAKRIMKALEKKGHHSDMLVLFGNNDPENHIYNFWGVKHNAIQYMKMAYHPVINRINTFGRKFKPEMFSRPRSLIDITSHDLYKKADIIHLHWVAHFLDYPSFFKKNNKPVVWTLHDQNPFTGGCHYSFECNNFLQNCNNCPQLVGAFNQNFSVSNINKKSQALKNFHKLHIVTPSNWLLELSRKSTVFKKILHTRIRHCLDPKEFFPENKSQARKQFNIPDDSIVLSFVSQNIEKEYKGFGLLINALKKIYADNIVLLAIGEQLTDTINSDIIIINTGFIDNTEILRKAYSASNLFVNPSLSESFSLTTAEAQMCGTPVLVFPVTAVQELVDHGINGIKTNKPDSDSLFQSIQLFIDNKFYFDCDKITNLARQNYSENSTANNYIKIYEELLKK